MRVRQGWAALAVLLVAAPAGAATVSGTVFRDVNGNGLRDGSGVTLEPSIRAAQVRGIDEFGNVGSATTDAAGAWSLTLPGTRVRLEFSTSLRIEPAAAPLTTVAFTTGNTSGINVGFGSPAQFCQDDPNVAAAVYSNGNPNSIGSAGSNTWMVRAPLRFAPDNNPAIAAVATGRVIGSTFGMAYHRSTDGLLAAALTKRHAGFGVGDGNPVVPLGTNTDETGAIYRIQGPDGATPTASLWLDLQAQGIATGSVSRVELPATNGIDPPPADAAAPNLDGDAFDKVGKTGLGGMALLNDETALYVVNLFDRQLYEVPIQNVAGVATPVVAGIVQHNLVASAPACTNGVFRPFGVGQRDGFIYVGGVCTAENAGGSAANLQAFVFRHDPEGANGNFTQVLSMPSTSRVVRSPCRGSTWRLRTGGRGSMSGPISWHPHRAPAPSATP